MKFITIALVSLFSAGCNHVPNESALRPSLLAGVYEGRDVVDTEERLTLRADQTFSYDFIPLGQAGESYAGRWKCERKCVILVGTLESGEKEDFPLEVRYEKSVPTLTYTWASLGKQRATMLIPNVFVRESEPNQQSSHFTPG